MKKVVLLWLLSFFAIANNLEITANNFIHKEEEKKAVFSGNVIAIQGENKIKANKLIVYLDENNEATEYRAVKDVYFEIKDKTRFIKGRCYELKYYPLKDKFHLIGNVRVEDVLNKRVIYGDEVIIDRKKNISIAKSSSKRPVKFIFKVKSKNESKK